VGEEEKKTHTRSPFPRHFCGVRYCLGLTRPSVTLARDGD
jgi:hypothetical protein